MSTAALWIGLHFRTSITGILSFSGTPGLPSVMSRRTLSRST
jgi:hypothetical protein